MDNNYAFSPNFPNEINMQQQNKNNINNNENNSSEKTEKNIEEKEENDNLGYIPGINYTNFINNNSKQHLDSTDSPMPAHFKYSIDIPNVSKQRLHEYLSEDLLNALEVSPNIPNLSNEIQNNEQSNIDNDPNNLYGFSLYPQNSSDIKNNSNNDNINYIPESNFNPNNNLNQRNNPNNIINNNFQNIYNNNINFNNYNYNINYQGMPNNNLINAFNNNPPMFIPKQLRNRDYKQNNNIIINEKNMKFNNNEKMNSKNKFDNGKKNMQNNKKEGKVKKPFEMRIGDWTCSKCSNLNFSFRNKCNRCGIPKELSEMINNNLMNQEMMKKNMNYNFPNEAGY